MDHQTISVYDKSAEEIASLHKSLVPTKIYNLVNQFFIKGELSADVGCGIGRDCAWLSMQGYPVIGIDASEGMLEQARKCFPNVDYELDSLPLLANQRESQFVNVLCSAVIMHLATNQVASAVANLIRITAPGGVMIISFRGTDSHDCRENGKLYSLIDSSTLISRFIHSGAMLLHCENDYQEGRGIQWTNIVFRKRPPLAV